MKKDNIDYFTVEGFGDEWNRFDQSLLSKEERQKYFDSYFSIFPKDILNKNSVGIDVGCGSGRWANLVAPYVRTLKCIDPSEAIEIAKTNLKKNPNCEFYKASVDNMPIDNNSMDFGYSLGVLHHVPNTQAAIIDCVKKLKSGAPFLLYLYYAFDNRPIWYRKLWQLSELLRYLISRLPKNLRYIASQIIAGFIYFPLARGAKLLKTLGINSKNMPLYAYRDSSFYTMRTDALDRFGTRLEQRFSKTMILDMMEKAGLENIKFSKNIPFWCAVGTRKY
jgi:ubiquinone/menaquinone biosynthesis C-methylase UbiE